MNNDMRDRTEKARAVKEAYQSDLLSKANVVGVGVGFQRKGGQQTKDIGLVVMVSKKLPEATLAQRDILPQQIEGIPIDVQEVGEIKAF
jgi:hypothetical protein